jgi:uncharacterized membrane protein YphA (DoxX/SURF4 family)
MVSRKSLHAILQWGIAAVWAFSGLYCKVLHLVPRHREIVAAILGAEHAALLTTAIGIGEIGLAVWIISGIRSRLCALLQIVLVVVMNIIEIIVTPDLLLFGRWNALIAAGFAVIVYCNEAFIRPGRPRKSVLWAHS